MLERNAGIEGGNRTVFVVLVSADGLPPQRLSAERDKRLGVGWGEVERCRYRSVVLCLVVAGWDCDVGAVLVVFARFILRRRFVCGSFRAHVIVGMALIPPTPPPTSY